MAKKQLSDGGPDGTCLGQSASDLISFYDSTPVDQPAAVASVTTGAITAVTTTGATSTTNAWGYTTEAQAEALVTAVNALITRVALINTRGNAVVVNLRELGLIAT